MQPRKILKLEVAHQLNEPSPLTQTIDLEELYGHDLSKSGVFDLRDMGASALGKLLEAIPFPIMLINKWFTIPFANKAFESICPAHEQIRNMRFLDLLPKPAQADRARTLAHKTMSLLETGFSERKPLKAEAILQFGDKKVWTRLHLRSVKISIERYILVIVEDITHERSLERISKRNEQALAQEILDLKENVECSEMELIRLQSQLNKEIRDHEATRTLLREALA